MNEEDAWEGVGEWGRDVPLAWLPLLLFAVLLAAVVLCRSEVRAAAALRSSSSVVVPALLSVPSCISISVPPVAPLPPAARPARVLRDVLTGLAARAFLRRDDTREGEGDVVRAADLVEEDACLGDACLVVGDAWRARLCAGDDADLSFGLDVDATCESLAMRDE